MASHYMHTMRSLEADRFNRSLLGLLFAVLLLTAWLGWFFFARLTIYEVSETAQLVRANKVVAVFPIATLGQIRRGQQAQLKLDSFSWTQYGTVPVHRPKDPEE